MYSGMRIGALSIAQCIPPLGGLVSYVAGKLPNVPAARHGAIAAAAQSAANGQAFSAEQVIDTLSAGLAWVSADTLSCFQDTAGTTPSTVGTAVGLINNWLNSGNNATQATTASKPALASGGLDFDGTDDFLAFASAIAPTAAISIVSVFNADSITGNRPIVDYSNAGGITAGYRYDINGAGGATPHRFAVNGTPFATIAALVTTNYISRAVYDQISVTVRLNLGTAATTARTGAIAYAGVANTTRIGTYANNAGAFDGRIQDVFISGAALNDGRIERFFNFYRSLGIV